MAEASEPPPKVRKTKRKPSDAAFSKYKSETRTLQMESDIRKGDWTMSTAAVNLELSKVIRERWNKLTQTEKEEWYVKANFRKTADGTWEDLAAKAPLPSPALSENNAIHVRLLTADRLCNCT